MRITLNFPGTNYSQNKKEITKYRKIVGCTSWTGSSWEGKLLTIETDFAKAASNAPRDYDGDILILEGNADLCDILTDMAKDWGADVIKDGVSRPKRKAIIYGPDTREFEWKSRGQSEKFREGWIALIMEEHKEKMAA